MNDLHRRGLDRRVVCVEFLLNVPRDPQRGDDAAVSADFAISVLRFATTSPFQPLIIAGCKSQ